MMLLSPNFRSLTRLHGGSLKGWRQGATSKGAAQQRISHRLEEYATKQVGEVTIAATEAPILITRHRKPRFVMMSREHYRRMRTALDPRRVYGRGETPDEVAELFSDALDHIIEEGEWSMDGPLPPGTVLAYEYLRRWQHQRGDVEGRRERPACVAISMVHPKTGQAHLVLLAISSQPRRPEWFEARMDHGQ